MALQQDEKQDPDANVQIEAGRFVVETNVKLQQLCITLRDKITKKWFKSSFAPSELELCGFNQDQSGKLETIGRLIQSAQTGEDGLKLNIIIPQVDNGDDEVQKIMNSVPGFRYAQVIIIREDKFFEDTKYSLKLDEITRDAPDVNADCIDDIKEDVNFLREQIDQLNADLSIAQQHRLPKGTIIDWYGAKKNIPKFWQIDEMNDSDDEEHEEEEGGETKIKDVFKYESDFDENGIIFALGSVYGTQDWQNPSITGLIEVRTAARMGRVSKPKENLTNREPGEIYSYINAAENNWFVIDFKNILIRPTNYTLRHDASPNNGGHLRNWQLQGSNDGDGDTWDVLIDHTDDKSLSEPDATHTWDIKDIDMFYQYFRVQMTGTDSSDQWFLCCAGFEIYGEIMKQDDDGGASKKMYTLIKIV